MPARRSLNQLPPRTNYTIQVKAADFIAKYVTILAWDKAVESELPQIIQWLTSSSTFQPHSSSHIACLKTKGNLRTLAGVVSEYESAAHALAAGVGVPWIDIAAVKAVFIHQWHWMGKFKGQYGDYVQSAKHFPAAVMPIGERVYDEWYGIFALINDPKGMPGNIAGEMRKVYKAVATMAVMMQNEEMDESEVTKEAMLEVDFRTLGQILLEMPQNDRFVGLRKKAEEADANWRAMVVEAKKGQTNTWRVREAALAAKRAAARHVEEETPSDAGGVDGAGSGDGVGRAGGVGSCGGVGNGGGAGSGGGTSGRKRPREVMEADSDAGTGPAPKTQAGPDNQRQHLQAVLRSLAEEKKRGDKLEKTVAELQSQVATMANYTKNLENGAWRIYDLQGVLSVQKGAISMATNGFGVGSPEEHQALMSNYTGIISDAKDRVVRYVVDGENAADPWYIRGEVIFFTYSRGPLKGVERAVKPIPKSDEGRAKLGIIWDEDSRKLMFRLD
ncbi:hypothetical protein B0T14DRAFT_587171 [Immersiella caudata]|uniref:Uncharacterized protein n=1 Tax=Immersiella caudata TaxID=314043 RepID=A0AA40C0C6_9PEZI|nr:hypothetical protein B0T14DRAFT_587171 [Immersiella caudata]